ncbi:uncharacterized protein K02A2.6-like [Ornithodoros turicata]|uniref:uncharacterized protein K02A2.6-like n=1 Tax=Ornithodoros turicata TaxID=34597 RepID=UPI0031394B86
MCYLLDTALAIAKQVEQAQTESALLATQQHHATVSAVARHEKKTPNACYRCGSTKHLANSPSCPARNKTCRSCKRKGHFESVCRQKSSAQATSVKEVDVDVYTTSTSTTKPIFCEIQAAGVPLRLLVDTGSAVSLLPSNVYHEKFSHRPLHKSGVVLRDYSKAIISTEGIFSATVCFGDRTATCTFHVVRKGAAIAGMDMLRALDIAIVPAQQLCRKVSATPAAQVPPCLAKYPTLFSEELGLAKGYRHKVTMRTSVEPVQQKLRRLPLEVRQKVSEELQKLEQSDIIERIDASEWVSPIVAVWKKTGELRLCVDLRKPNTAIVIDSHPLPHMEDIFHHLAGASYFSKLDLSSAYHQMELAEESRNLTAFITHEGLFRYKRVCFGLASAAAAFQKMLAMVLKGLKGVMHYLDDILVYGATMEEHNLRLDRVLFALEAAGLRLNKKKCVFATRELQFLGHSLSPDGLSPLQDTLEAIRDAPSPQDVVSLRSFLGLASYYLKFVPHFATVVEPLRRLLRKETRFLWTEEQETAFNKVKSLIQECVPLALFDASLPTIVTADASNFGLGAVLQQEHPDGLRTVCFASRAMTATEYRYSTGEKEALACLWACEKWHVLLFGRKFTLCTDHQALVTLLSTQGTGRQPMRIARWAARLLQYNYTIAYKKGEHNFVADALSRLPLPHKLATTGDEDEDELVCYVQQALSCITMQELLQAMDDDVVLRQVLSCLEHDPQLDKQQQEQLSPYLKLRGEITSVGGIVLRGSRIIPPSSLRKRIVDIAHESHSGIVRTKQRIRERYWWPRMDAEIETYVRDCYICREADKTAVTHKAPLQPVPFPCGPWKQLGIDIVGPFGNLPARCRFAITAVDYFSKWPEVAFFSHVTTEVILEFLMDIFVREGYPEILVSDHGPQFEALQFKNFLAERGILHRQSAIYHPEANGQVERFNRVLKGFLQTISLTGRIVSQDVKAFLGIYRATPHAATGLSPSELLHQRRMKSKLDVAGFPNLDKDIQREMASLRERIKKYQEKTKAYFDERHRVRTPKFQPGDYVRVHLPGHRPKGSRAYGPPIAIQEKVGLSTFVLADGTVRNASRLAASEVGQQPVNSGLPTQTNATLRRSERTRKPPDRFRP